MTAGLDELITAAQDVNAGKMLYTIGDFEMPSLSALAVELSYLPRLFGLLARFDKCAVICDQAWIRTVAEIEGAVLPGLEIKSFPADQAQAAEAWLTAG